MSRSRGTVAVRALLLPLVAGLAACAATPAPQAARPMAPAAGSAGEPAWPEHSRLVGMDSRAVEGLLGTPVMLRREQPAQYWRYSHAGCAIDMFLYVEPSSGTWRVAHVAVRPADSRAPAHAAHCEQMQASLGGTPEGPALPAVESY